MSEPTWVVMVIAGAPEFTDAAISDVLAQSVPTRLLLIGQGLDHDYREHLERIAEAHDERVFCWFFDPALPSLSAAWNRGLQFVWECGGVEALVVNNDTRFHRDTVSVLTTVIQKTKALFVSAVGVTAEQFDPTVDHWDPVRELWKPTLDPPGGPDFSAFLMTKEGHTKYPFDEGFVPLYGEDCDMHRRYMLGGDGPRIFSVNMPYWHIGGGSGTLKSMAPEARARLERRIDGSRAYYARKWGPGGINGETFTIPFDAESAQPNVTNPDLQRAAQGALGS